jgi:NAD(P)-dependent dehydrogenase (short-subunit alcohol dehydrogenase family)
VVLVTGAGTGVGRAIALRFARDGHPVAAAGRSEDTLRQVCAEISDAGGRAFPARCDVADRASVAAAVAAVEEALGPVSVLVNNAGIAESAPFADMADELWDRTIAINLTGAYNCMRRIVPAMLSRGWGRVINVASTAAKVGYPFTSAYVASKHGMLGLTRAAAVELRGKGVTVNAICPGWVDTDMTHRAVERIAERTGRSVEDARVTLERMNARKRLVDPEEIATAALYFASPAADGITGQDIEIQ